MYRAKATGMSERLTAAQLPGEEAADGSSQSPSATSSSSYTQGDDGNVDGGDEEEVDNAERSVLAELQRRSAENVRLRRNFEEIKGLHSDLQRAYSASAVRSVAAEAAAAELDAHFTSCAQAWAARLEEQQAAAAESADRNEQLRRTHIVDEARKPLLARVRSLEAQLRTEREEAMQMKERLDQMAVERRTDAEAAAIKLELVETAAQEELASCRSRIAALEVQGQNAVELEAELARVGIERDDLAAAHRTDLDIARQLREQAIEAAGKMEEERVRNAATRRRLEGVAASRGKRLDEQLVKIQSLEGQVASTAEESRRVHQERAEEREAYERESSALQAGKHAAEAQRDQALQQLRTTQLQLQDAQLAAQRAEAASQAVRDEHQARADAIAAEGQAAKEAMQAQMQADFDATCYELCAKAETLEVLRQAAQERAEALAESLEGAKAVNERLQQSVKEAEAETGAAAAAARAAQQKHADLRAEVARLSKKKAAADAAITRLEQQQRCKDEDKNAAEQQVRQSQEQIRCLMDAVEEKEAHLRSLHLQHEAAIQELQENLQEGQARELQELRSQYTKRDESIRRRYRRVVGHERRKNSRLEEDLTTCQGEKLDLQRTLDETAKCLQQQESGLRRVALSF